jgi:hypothetical protein
MSTLQAKSVYFFSRRIAAWPAGIGVYASRPEFYASLAPKIRSKVDVLRDSHKLLVTPYREFERQFGGKTVLAGLRLKKQLMVVSKITFEV